ncbi:MAG TPA: AlpA family transcriptional regulator [Gammaproteobacteria bacterium]|nr:AlpA family transcriptional regulator [Gammaproteobacteria bacterium]
MFPLETQDKLLRIAQVEAATGLKKSALYRLASEGRFPKPLKITGARASAWPESQVQAWIRERIAGTAA